MLDTRYSKKQKTTKTVNSIDLIGTDDTSKLTPEQLTSNCTSNKELILQEMLNEEVSSKIVLFLEDMTCPTRCY